MIAYFFSDSEEDNSVPMTTLTVNLRTNLPLSKVRITITVQEPIRVAQATHVVNSISEKLHHA